MELQPCRVTSTRVYMFVSEEPAATRLLGGNLENPDGIQFVFRGALWHGLVWMVTCSEYVCCPCQCHIKLEISKINEIHSRVIKNIENEDSRRTPKLCRSTCTGFRTYWQERAVHYCRNYLTGSASLLAQALSSPPDITDCLSLSLSLSITPSSLLPWGRRQDFLLNLGASPKD